MQKQPFVLMLEEDQDDRQLTESVLQELGFDVPIKFVKYSNEFFTHLENGDEPSLILVDYNATPVNGTEILKQLKANTAYNHIPVVMLGEGLPPHSVRQVYQFGASSYITKPVSNKLTRDKIETFFKYWLNVAEIA
jgi:CheY-like chemotaxis protein